MMSSWTNVAKWIISMITATATESSVSEPTVPPAKATRVGRNCLPWFSNA